ncbi:hypothetical protein L210DRAFT_3523234 [Boletus edulis BED1]|uniref:Wax synthase domain-containing protein n=1 Tax=Boletus edulis BED1 TaxID=1328754 RepID=A0AAD4GK37_BOLED|nr:hypothetical protein L210DRAFT_3523234 [Boletus edulis BED1]
MQMIYDLCTVFGIVLLEQDPAQWPPAFDPSDFWGRRWRQFLRYTFLLLGGYPLSLIWGRSGVVIGAFLAVAPHRNAYIGWPGGILVDACWDGRPYPWLTGRWVGRVIGWVWTILCNESLALLGYKDSANGVRYN